MNKYLLRWYVYIIIVSGIVLVAIALASRTTHKQKSFTVSITVLPGSTINTISKLFGRSGLPTQDFLRMALPKFDGATTSSSIKLDDRPAGSGLEGYLYPDTYNFASYQSADDMANMMILNFNKHFPYELFLSQKTKVRGLHEVVIMASILEKEVDKVEDKKIVSGILWKRLDARLPLQVDSTNSYFLTPPKGVTYNTYKYSGLPFGPISNPSEESLIAALEPVTTDYWYFLSTRDGNIVYSKTLSEHLINKAKYVEQI